VVRVVYGQADPNPLAAGGAARLAAAGVAVEGGLLADRASAVNPVWTAALRMGRPFVTWKFAASLDGRSAAADGSSQWITSLAARQDVHRLRALCDAIVAGTGTVFADDPHLTARPGGVSLPPQRQPLRVVVGKTPLPPGARVLDDAAPTLLLPTHDVAQALAELWRRDRQHVWLEGGPRLAGAFLEAGLVDEVVGYLAPVLLGAGRHALDDAGVSSIGEAVRLRITDVTPVGEDLRITAVPAFGREEP
jgi:diaminohydroxyphosphoribosylaminopyrimidine deaminase/5-amino-6-(5-phosphoribosylamino)uracil reductase